ncbi:longiborneol synthase [Fusarium pseudoanthophilum]|uniref:Longiborneol synthase n=1 Tax=Fusarium pseudoanthophilum TaxID=48495 RepID=A0A8H5P4X9_9HYPO|nr:longiborneol synthase [Fusarium pseudoanthophilum]
MGPTLSSLRSRWSHPQLREPLPGGVERQLEPKPRDLKSFIQPLIASFTNEIGYSPFKTTSNDALWMAMRAHADNTGVPCEEGSHSWLMFKVGYVYPVVSTAKSSFLSEAKNSQVCFPHHPFEVQLYIGIYSWLGLLLDDQAAEYLEEFSMFHERFCADGKQPIPLLQAWADLMKLTFKYWDPLVASFIVTASLNFLNSNALEARKEFHQIERTKAGRSWAWFLREKDGLGEAYAWFTFPKALCPDISLFLEVIPDISIWIGLTNDVLSAWYEDKDPHSVFEEIVDEITTKAQQMRLVLKDREPYLKLLNSHLLGYIAFHKLNSRYRLWEVGLGEDATDRTVLGS